MATPAPKGLCRLFGSNEGCKYGKNCKFSHELRSTSGTRPSVVQSSQQKASSFTPATLGGRSGNTAPKNVCNFYWNTGQCDRGFDCTFKHQKKFNSQSGSTNAGTEDQEDAANTALEFFSMENLTQMAGVGLHSTQEGTPENAHNSIKRYLGGGSLNKPADMRQLISILASVNRRNHLWVCVLPPFKLDGC